MARITVLIPSIDSIKPKNILQFSSLAKLGVQYIVITNEIGDSNLENDIDFYPFLKVYVVRPGYGGVFQSFFRMIRVLLSNKVDIVEIYPNGMIELLDVLILKLLNIRALYIARGQEKYYLEDRMTVLQNFGFKYSYQLCNNVLIKERYMHSMMDAFGIKNKWELPNAINIPSVMNEHSPERCRFLYANSFKEFRYPENAVEAFIGLCEMEDVISLKCNVELVVVGYDIGENETSRNQVIKLVKDNPRCQIKLIPFSKEVDQFFAEADVFLLPASLVYVNNSLLEAMSRGICPIIQNADASELLVVDGKSGYVVGSDINEWQAAMSECVTDFKKRASFGLGAREHVRSNFSNSEYTAKYAEIYESITGIDLVPI